MFPQGFLWVYVHAAWRNLEAVAVMLTSGLFSRNGEQFVSNFFFYRRQSSTINNSAVIKQFLGQWAPGNFICSLNHPPAPRFVNLLPHSHILGFINYFTHVTKQKSFNAELELVAFFSAPLQNISRYTVKTVVRLTLPSITQAVVQVQETVCEGCIVAAVQFRQRRQ